MASLPPALRVRRIHFAAAPRAGWSDIGMYRGVAIAAPVGGHTACMPLHIPDTANRSCPGAQGECGSRRLPVSIPPCPRTRGPRFRECVDKVHDLASSKLSHAALGARRRPTTNPEFPRLLTGGDRAAGAWSCDCRGSYPTCALLERSVIC